MSFNRGLVSRNRYTGVLIADAGTIATFENVVIEGTREQVSDENGGRGLEVSEDAQLSLSRGNVSGNRYVGALLAAVPSRPLRMWSLKIRNLRPPMDDVAEG